MDSQMEVDSTANTLEDFKRFKIAEDAPTVLIVMGMAGSGKTTFVQVRYLFIIVFFVETDCALEAARQADIQYEFGPGGARGSLSLQY